VPFYGGRAVFDNAGFPWVAEVERKWQTIRRELDELLARQDELPTFNEIIGAEALWVTRDRPWKTFFLLGYGLPFRQNIALCPETWRILRSIPGLKTAMFSILEPGKHIPPHRDPYNGVLRFHLGLIVPEPREALGISRRRAGLPLGGGQRTRFRRPLRTRGVERDRRDAGSALLRFPQAAPLSGQSRQPTRDFLGGVHARYSRRTSEPSCMGNEFPPTLLEALGLKSGKGNEPEQSDDLLPRRERWRGPIRWQW
jgi:hypothetical protein